MKKAKCIGIIVLSILLGKPGISQQMKLGDNPYSVEKSAVLDLVSTNQGLLLPRITDTASINALNPPNGMLIYYAPANKMLIRKNGQWQGVVSQDSSRVSTLADASINLPQIGQILEYNGSSWVNITPSYLTSIDTSNIPNFYQKVRGLFTGVAPISLSANGHISISQAGTNTDGYLNSSDWNTFNNKQPAGNYLTGLTGDVTATGPGSVAATIAANAVTYPKIQNVSATNKVLGRVSSGSGIIEEISTTGTGDVVRSISPALSNPTGIVKGDVGLGNVNNTADSLKPVSNATQTALNLKINLSEKGANNGVATLNSGGKVPLSQLAIGAQTYLGTWSAVTNTPYVQDGTGSAGDTYRVIESGTIDLGSGNLTLYSGDDIIYNGSIWQRNPSTADVTSVNGQTGTVVLISDDVNEGSTNKYYTDARANLKVNVSEKGVNNGVATLDAGGKVPASQLPVGAQVYKGTWDASNNTPTLADGTGTAGWTYRVIVAGTQNLGSGNITFSVGDDAIHDGSVWQRSPGAASVTSVNSQTGVVTLTTDEINEGNNNQYFTNARVRAALSASAPLNYSSGSGNFSIPKATSSVDGYLSNADWNTFNNKQSAGNYISALTGDVTASGPGSVGATIATNAVTYSKMQAMTANKLLGSGLSGTSVAEITLGTGLSFTGTTLNAATTGGTVTSVSAGDLSPLFTTSVSNPTTTPTLSFSFNSQSQNLVFASPISSSGTPTFRSLAKADLPSTGVYNDQSNTYTSGSKQIFTASNINADIRLTGYSADPSTLANGDIWYNSTSHLLKYRASGTTRTFANLDEAQTFTNKTISGSTNTLTNIGNSSLTNSTIGLILGTSGTDVGVSGSPASLGSSITLNIPSASSTNRGLLTAADWNSFNSKLGTIDTTNISNFYLKVRSLLSAGAGITYNNNTGVITNSGVTSVNNNTGALTMDTGYISNFYSKVRSLFSGSAPVTYSNGSIGITQAGSSSNGYLSSTDWNTFNNKQSSGNFLADPGGNGVVVRTALNTTINRTITGTANKITLTNGDGVSGNPTINVGGDIVDETIANTYTGGAKQTFANSASTAGLNLTASADPSTLASGDLWNSTTTANSLKYRDAASTTRTLVDLSLTQTLTNKTISGASNTITNIPNSALTNSSITVATGTTGTDVGVSGSPVSLGGTVTLNIPIASGTNTGKLSSTDWTTFNNKQSSGNYMTDPGGNGVVVRTALNTTTNRTITGTANKITLTNGDGVSGNPTINVGGDIVDETIANTYTGGAKQTFVNSAATAGLNLTASADPSTLASGDLWNSTTTANSLKYRDAASTTRTLVDLSLTQTLTNKTISGASNTITNIPNSALTNSSITVATGTTGTNVSVSGSPVSLGGTVTLNIPTASGTNTGKLSSADWTTFNNKVSSQWTTSGSDIYYNTGNVGIGTASPSKPLHIAVSQATNPGLNHSLIIENTNGEAELQLNPGGTGSTYNLSADDGVYGFRIFENTTARFRIHSGGNVVIGDIDPTSNLQVVGSQAGSYRSGTGAYTILSTDYIVLNTGAAATWTLPDPTLSPGRIYMLVNHGTGTITLSRTVRTASGSTTTSLSSTAGSNCIQMFSDGTEWRRKN